MFVFSDVTFVISRYCYQTLSALSGSFNKSLNIMQTAPLAIAISLSIFMKTSSPVLVLNLNHLFVVFVDLCGDACNPFPLKNRRQKSRKPRGLRLGDASLGVKSVALKAQCKAV